MKPLPFLHPAAGSPAVRNPGRPAVIVPSQAVTAEALDAECAAAAATSVVDAIEWRIDPLLAMLMNDSVHAATHVRAAAPVRTAAGVVGTAAGVAGTAGAGMLSLAEAVLHLLPHATSAELPVLLTVRTAAEGGDVEITETDYAELLRGLTVGLVGTEAGSEGLATTEAGSEGLVGTEAGSERLAGTEEEAAVQNGADQACAEAGGAVPVALDVEIDRAESHRLIAEARAQGVPVVASHHNFTVTDPPESLRRTYRDMDEAGADVAKVAMMPQAPVDVAHLLEATAEAAAASARPVLGIAMGPLGRASRIMGADFGSCATFAQVGRASAPGQIDAIRLAEILDRLGD